MFILVWSKASYEAACIKKREHLKTKLDQPQVASVIASELNLTLDQFAPFIAELLLWNLMSETTGAMTLCIFRRFQENFFAGKYNHWFSRGFQFYWDFMVTSCGGVGEIIGPSDYKDWREEKSSLALLNKRYKIVIDS